MTDRFLVDTNVLVYAYDRAYPLKQRKSLEVLDHLILNKMGCLSTQILAEFFNVVTSKISSPLSQKEAETQVDNFIRSSDVVDVTPLIVIEAIRGVREHGFSYWDSQIWASARLNQIPFVISEDFGRSFIEGVRYLDPFKTKLF